MIEFYAAHKVLVWIVAILLPLAGCLVHYISFGPHTGIVDRAASVILVRRFGIREWISHWLMLLGFMALLVTGFMLVVPGIEPDQLGLFHELLGFSFSLISLGTLLAWLPDALFRSFDWQWMRQMGGYLSRNPQPLPAGRFNAGQKIYYWLLLVILIGLLVSAIIMEQGAHSPDDTRDLVRSLHGMLGCMATIMVIGHWYLSVFANPDTARVLWSGRVSKAYTDECHALWKAPTK